MSGPDGDEREPKRRGTLIFVSCFAVRLQAFHLRAAWICSWTRGVRAPRREAAASLIKRGSFEPLPTAVLVRSLACWESATALTPGRRRLRPCSSSAYFSREHWRKAADRDKPVSRSSFDFSRTT